MKKREPVKSITRTRSETTTTDSVPDQRHELRARMEEAELSSNEERVIRMYHGLPIDDDRPLETKTNDPALLRQLAEIELNAFRAIMDPPEEDPRDRIMARLQRRR